VSGPIPHHAENQEDRVEMPQMARQQRERRERAPEDGQAGQNNAPRRIAIEQPAERRRAGRNRQRRDAEGYRDRFAFRVGTVTAGTAPAFG
jgi:hypothetical protein